MRPVTFHTGHACRYIATEFAGIYNGFGREVHVIFRGDKVLKG